ncbi:hypothetical protein [Polaribacter sargassicola]|uniref:hypothetical protein n=1 Tax=Polaribacter sargassicola TaxID=2836891 RepID=UPI001F2B4C94|nr:hypothetical protein [Polaribacter sp. DS7-9]MCG1035954.1 hypothetical protein [Polaribacter sp. DS7-9]
MKKLVFLLVILFFINSFGQEPSTFKEMKADKSMSEFFTDNELEDLSTIVDFFESQLCLEKNITKEACYFNFNKETITNAINGNNTNTLDLKIDYKLQLELYSEIDSLFLKEIWRHPTYFKDKYLKNKVVKENYDLDQFGKYMQFLESLKEEDVLFRDFYDLFYISNEISFSVNAVAFYKFKKEEFKGIKRRLFFAIYYLTVNDKINNITRR